MKRFKQFLRWFWLTLVVCGISLFVFNPEFFSAESLQMTLNGNYTLVLIAFVLFSCVRSLFFLPSTLFVLMGITLYPKEPFFVLFISMLGILIGASLVYKAASILTPEQFFKGKNLTRLEGIHRKMEKYGVGVVLFWSFFPVVPTDLICYVAGAIKMSYWKFILAVFIGEIVLVLLYIWTGKSILELIM